MKRSIVLFALALCAVLARAEDKVDIKAKHAEGDACDVRTTITMKLSGTVQGQPISTKHDGTEEYREKTVEVKDGQPARAERTYKANKQTLQQSMGMAPPQTQSQENPIVGKTVTLVRKEGKVQLETRPEAGELDEGDLDFCTDDTEVLLPGEPVAVGGQWEVSNEKLTAAFGATGMKVASAKCTLEEIAERDGTRVARIKVEVAVKGEEGGAKMEGELSGPFLFDLTAGRPVSISLKGKMKVDMGMAVLEGPLETETSYTPVK
ncbi:MAG TPA: hypothetical protein VFY93_17360 [Planctomycetota bacterium]|nr:hypothetical protein [Planctomycetota bacterium]